MSPRLTRKPFGDYTLVTIGTDENHVSFVAEKSAYIHQIRLKGIDLLWNYANGEALTENQGHRNLALLPFPNRLLNGKYSWLDNSFFFDVNHPETDAALHGFGADANFQLERVDMGIQSITARLAYLHTQKNRASAYPFLVLFSVELKVDIDSGSVLWSLSAKNLDDKNIPVGLGWHPYYLLPGGIDQWKLRLPEHQQVVLSKGIPTGEVKAGLSSKPTSAINTAWDDCFLLSSETNRDVYLSGSAYSLTLKQLGATRYTQLYVPPNQGSLAIEPMSCGVNAFQDQPQEITLAPGEEIYIGLDHRMILAQG